MKIEISSVDDKSSHWLIYMNWGLTTERIIVHSFTEAAEKVLKMAKDLDSEKDEETDES